MLSNYFFASLTRIADLADLPFETVPLPRDEWATGDYVLGEVTHAPKGRQQIELPTGRMVEVTEGDLVVGAFSSRRATLEVVGDWQSIGEDGVMHALTAAGLMGRVTSLEPLHAQVVCLRYRGHIVRNGVRVAMKQFVAAAPQECRYDCPTILLYGTSMSAGKTSAAKVIIRQLVAAGYRVVGSKLTGAGRYRDILVMQDAGAEAVFDFVDVGLPSSVCPRDEYRGALAVLLSLIAAEKADVVVAEAGASPLEPYNGDIVMEAIGAQLAFRVLCASDPYAVVGVMRGFDLVPDIVAGVATNTSAGIALIQNLADIEALNLMDPASHPRLRELLYAHLPAPAGCSEPSGRMEREGRQCAANAQSRGEET